MTLKFPASQSTLRIAADFDVDSGQWDTIVLDDTALEELKLSHAQIQRAGELIFSSPGE
jgi:hypothetical protein